MYFYILDTNSSNQRNAAAIYYNKAGSFEILHGLLDRVMEVLEIKFDPAGGKNTYHIKGKDSKFYEQQIHTYSSNLDPTFFPGRAAEITYCKSDGSSTVLGVLGVLHPEVLSKFDLSLPCCALELNIEPFV